MNDQKIKNLELNSLTKHNYEITMEWNLLEVLKDEIYLELNPTLVNSLKYKFKNKGILQKVLAKKLNVVPPAINQWFSSNTKIPYKAILKFFEILKINKNTLTKNIDGIALDSGIVKVHKPHTVIKFDKNFARFLGHIYGDGSVRNNFTVSFTNLNKDLVNDFISLVKKIFGDIDCYIYNDDNDGTINVTLPLLIGKFLVKCFDDIQCKKIPLKYLLSNKSAIPEFIGALFDGEGYVSVKKSCLEIQLSKQHMLEDLKILFSAVGIETSPIYKKVNQHWGFMYRINIYRRKNIKKFYESINLKHKNKAESIQKLLNNYSRRFVDYELREAILEKLKKRSLTSSELVTLLKGNLSSICKCLVQLEKLKLVKKEKVYRKGINKKRYMINLWSLK